MTEDSARRSTLARIGVTALNFLAPGLGLLRVGWSLGAAVTLTLPTLIILVLAGLFAVTPIFTFAAIIATALFLIIGVLAVYLFTLVVTWKRSAYLSPRKPWWSRWYSLLAVSLLEMIVPSEAAKLCHRFYKPFYMPAEGMAPLLATNDRIVADMRGGRQPAPGDIILVAADSKAVYVKRVAALGGDRIAIKDGVPVINGVPARQIAKGVIQYAQGDGSSIRARLIAETFPGEKASHDIIDLGYTPDLDDIPERTVPTGHIFVLGDNRDRSADSRVPPWMNGLDMVPIDRIRGRPLFITWSADRSKIGRDATH